jgi:hypothetical protein
MKPNREHDRGIGEPHVDPMTKGRIPGRPIADERHAGDLELLPGLDDLSARPRRLAPARPFLRRRLIRATNRQAPRERRRGAKEPGSAARPQIRSATSGRLPLFAESSPVGGAQSTWQHA